MQHLPGLKVWTSMKRVRCSSLRGIIGSFKRACFLRVSPPQVLVPSRDEHVVLALSRAAYDLDRGRRRLHPEQRLCGDISDEKIVPDMTEMRCGRCCCKSALICERIAKKRIPTDAADGRNPACAGKAALGGALRQRRALLKELSAFLHAAEKAPARPERQTKRRLHFSKPKQMRSVIPDQLDRPREQRCIYALRMALLLARVE
jgi:hypothetical protein